ncbi:M23 family metallopeptidase [Georgenia wangjunii]|uniref:M23 family metallopeptidase n=1 Tax=Georgenia wangjunii TaxID=3117730 RepID=UPI002F261B14
MPEPAGAPEPMVGAGDVQPATGAPRAGAARPGWLRRATLVGSAAALVGVTALAGLGTAVPSVSKGTQDGYVTSELLSQLEAVPGSRPEALPAAGMAVISSVDTQVKAPGGAFAPTPTSTQAASAQGAACVALPLSAGSYRLTSPYGYRIHPIQGIYSLHTGVDYAAPLGTPIHAVTDGTVVYTGAGRAGRSSELVIIEHEIDGTTFYSWYVHMYPDGVFVTPGQEVRAGEVIAEVGNNGNSTGPHLHFEIHTSDPGLGNRKNPVVRTTSAMVMSVDPTDAPAEWDNWPINGLGYRQDPEDATVWRHPGTGELVDPATAPSLLPPATEEPTTPPPTGEPTTPPPTEAPTTPPATGEPTTPPATGEPTTPPATGEPTTPPATGEPTTPPPTGGPTTPPPTGGPTTPPPTGTPTDGPTDPVTGEPTTPPAQPGGPTATPSPGPHTPFPVAAYGTTVDPARFLASLGILMVDPVECAAP